MLGAEVPKDVHDAVAALREVLHVLKHPLALAVPDILAMEELLALDQPLPLVDVAPFGTLAIAEQPAASPPHDERMSAPARRDRAVEPGRPERKWAPPPPLDAPRRGAQVGATAAELGEPSPILSLRRPGAIRPTASFAAGQGSTTHQPTEAGVDEVEQAVRLLDSLTHELLTMDVDTPRATGRRLAEQPAHGEPSIPRFPLGASGRGIGSQAREPDLRGVGGTDAGRDDAGPPGLKLPNRPGSPGATAARRPAAPAALPSNGHAPSSRFEADAGDQAGTGDALALIAGLVDDLLGRQSRPVETPAPEEAAAASIGGGMQGGDVKAGSGSALAGPDDRPLVAARPVEARGVLYERLRADGLDLEPESAPSDDVWHAEHLAELVNDVLVEQARRHGVDLS